MFRKGLQSMSILLQYRFEEVPAIIDAWLERGLICAAEKTALYEVFELMGPCK